MPAQNLNWSVFWMENVLEKIQLLLKRKYV